MVIDCSSFFGSTGCPHFAEQPVYATDPAGFPYSAAGCVHHDTTTTAKTTTAVKASDAKAAPNL